MSLFVVTGATGSVGKAIVKELLVQGHQIRILSTRLSYKQEGCEVKHWDPMQGKIAPGALEGADYLIHLAGATVSKRWTASYKQLINTSRVQSTQVLIDELERTKNGPKVCVSASAIGYYGSDFDRTMVETDPPADDFLAAVTQEWERYTQKLSTGGRTSIQLRIGIVLDLNAGVLGQLLPITKLGLASPLGSGKQWSSWIHVKDLARMFIHAATKDIPSGAYNAVGDQPVTNATLTKMLAKAVNRPAFLPAVPGFLLKLMLGEMATLALMSQKVNNQKIKDTGFKFEFENLSDALKDLLD